MARFKPFFYLMQGLLSCFAALANPLAAQFSSPSDTFPPPLHQRLSVKEPHRLHVPHPADKPKQALKEGVLVDTVDATEAQGGISHSEDTCVDSDTLKRVRDEISETGKKSTVNSVEPHTETPQRRSRVAHVTIGGVVPASTPKVPGDLQHLTTPTSAPSTVELERVKMDVVPVVPEGTMEHQGATAADSEDEMFDQR
ncbi:hypothetical protein MRX96_018615 [Rhipicephalus microplus]